MTSRGFFSWAVADLFVKVTIEFILGKSATNWSFSPFLCSMTHMELSEISSGNPSGLGLRIFASILFKVDTFAESNRVRMVADWRQNRPKRPKFLPQVGASCSSGVFPPIQQGFEPVKFQQIAKPRICLRFCVGLVHGTNVSFWNLLRGLGFKTSHTLSMSRMHLIWVY